VRKMRIKLRGRYREIEELAKTVKDNPTDFQEFIGQMDNRVAEFLVSSERDEDIATLKKYVPQSYREWMEKEESLNNRIGTRRQELLQLEKELETTRETRISVQVLSNEVGVDQSVVPLYVPPSPPSQTSP